MSSEDDSPQTAETPEGGSRAGPAPAPPGTAAPRAPDAAAGPAAEPSRAPGSKARSDDRPARRGPGLPVVFATVALLGVLLGWNVPRRDFWNPGEPTFAHIIVSMEESGDWLVPTFDGEPYLHLPPLTYWLAAASHRATRLPPEISYRLPVIIFAACGLLLTYFAGRRFFDGRVGYLALVIQGSTYSWFSAASWLDDDLIFAVFCQLAVTALALAARTARSMRWSVLGFAALAGAALTKSGLLALVLVLGPLIPIVFLDPDVAFARGMRRAIRPLAVLVFLALAVPWYAYVASQHGTLLWESHFLEEHSGRLVNATDHRQYPYYYLLVLLGGFLPWTLYLPLGFLHGKDRTKQPGQRFAFFTWLFALVVLSFVSSKKPGYLLLVWSPLCLLVSSALFEESTRFSLWEDYLRGPFSRILQRALQATLIIALAFAGLILSGRIETGLGPVLALVGLLPEGRANDLGALFPPDANLYPVVLLVVAAGALAFYAAGRVERSRRAGQYPRMAFEFGCASAFVLFVGSLVAAGLGPIRSPRPFIEEVAATVGEQPLRLYGHRLPEVYYYLGRTVELLEYPDPLDLDDPVLARIEEYLARDDRVYLLTSAEELRLLRQNFPPLRDRLFFVRRGHLGWWRELVDFLLVSNRADEAARAGGVEGEDSGEGSKQEEGGEGEADGEGSSETDAPPTGTGTGGGAAAEGN